MHDNNAKKHILLLSKDRDIIQLLRSKIANIKPHILLHLSKTSSSLTAKDSVIIVDTRFDYSREIVTAHSDIPTIYLTEKTGSKHIEQLFKNGATDVLTFPVNDSLLLCLTNRYIGELEIEYQGVYKYKGITICRDSSYIEYNGCKVFLTNKELSVLECLTKTEYSGKENSKSFQVTVSRINSKTREGIGLRIIKNRYAKGYYIAL